ncbi:pirin family protein [Penaeicola halotolerans]|uniref:pirin family protein n=1 Tax=Penaeicola halotolerans TaxID=2793196 RepID=UPI001CF8831E|nr:pirin family protein [Penaeicola halotolerans]
MSNTGLIIEERASDIGDFLVGRLLPFRKKRMVGPFIFIDHMGPAVVKHGSYLDIGQHPHIGLSTLTYLFEGEIMHEDSIGTKQRITPGSVNWMTGGRGMTHTERTPEDYRDGRTTKMHGFQIWVALPKDLEDMEPNFTHVAASELPKWTQDHLHFTLVAGEAFGKKSPVPVYSPLFMIEVHAKENAQFDAGTALKGEIGICVIKGSITACDQEIGAGNMLVAKDEDYCKIGVSKDAHLLIFGGEAFPEERFIYWNFVASDKATLEIAKEKWKNKDFPMVKGDTSYIPLPER